MALEISGKLNAGMTPDTHAKNFFTQHEAPTPKTTHKNLEKQLNEDELRKSVEILEQTGLMFNKRLQFSINKKINRIVVKVIDGATDTVIREIPPDEIQRLIAHIKEAIGVLVDERI